MSKIIQFLFFAFILAVVTFENSLAKFVTCGKIADVSWTHIGTQKACYIDLSSVIESPGYTVQWDKDDSITAFNIAGNKNIFYLPDEVSENFTKLLTYGAHDSGVKAIRKSNFAGMSMVKALFLFNNRIEKVPSDVFDDMKALIWVYLRENRIKSISGEAFKNQNSLLTLSLNKNLCIDQDFSITDSSKMRRIITGSCGHEEPEDRVIAEIQQLGKYQTETFQNAQNSLENCQSRTLFSETALMKLDAELKAAIVAKVQCESNLKFAQTTNSKNEEFANVHDLKSRKINELMSEVEIKNQKIIANSAEIKRLNDKVEMLSKA